MLEEIEHLMRFTRCPNETVFTIELPERCKEDFQGWINKTFEDNVFYVSLKGDEIDETEKETFKQKVSNFYFPATGFIKVKFYNEKESPVPTYIKFKQ